jgi:NADPH-dependent 2,4-dienoyl-CoA reductase/sulfur reductase-like enzyme
VSAKGDASDSNSRDVVVVGGGPAGLAAAAGCVAAGRSVLLVDAMPKVGGPIWRDGSSKQVAQRERLIERILSGRGEIMTNTQVVGVDHEGKLLIRQDANTQRVVASRILLATGSREFFVPFPGWTLPQVCGVGGLQVMAKAGLSLQKKRVVVAGTGPLLLACAEQMVRAGATLVAIVEQASMRKLLPFAAYLAAFEPARAWQGLHYRAKTFRAPFYSGAWIARALGQEALEAVHVHFDAGVPTKSLAADFLACAYGLVANTELAQALGCNVVAGRVVVDDSYQTTKHGVYACGEVTRVGGLEKALFEGEAAAAAICGRASDQKSRKRRFHSQQRFIKRLEHTFALHPAILHLSDGATTVCRCEGVSWQTIADYRHAHKHGDARSLRLGTRCGMGRCQGRICGPFLERSFGQAPNSPSFPLTPTPLHVLGSQGPHGHGRDLISLYLEPQVAALSE